MIARAEIYQLPARTHGDTHRRHMVRDALCQGSTLEAVIQKDHRLVPGLSKEPAIGNGCLQCTSPPFSQQCLATVEPHPDAQTMCYEMQAVCSPEARRRTGIVQSLVKYSPAQILVEDSQLDRPSEVSKKREALNCDVKFLRRLRRRYQKTVSVALIHWEKDKDEEGSFDTQDEASDLLYLA
jgi:hypothetical protein